MKKSFALVAILAASIGTAAAQRSHTAGSNSGGSSSAGNANNTVSGGNSSNTSSSAPNNNPTTTTPNYKPAAKPKGTGKDTKKPTGGEDTKVVVSSGGQGHNSTRDPKGKTLVAPSASNSGKKK